MAHHDTLARLDDLLAREAEALRTGQLVSLGDLLPEKESLLALLPDQVDLPERRIRDLRLAARRNGALLQAALKGLQAAQARLDQMRGRGAPLRTYGQDGQRQTIGPQRGALNLRA